MLKLKSILTAALLMLVLTAPVLADDPQTPPDPTPGNIGTPGLPGNTEPPGINDILTAILIAVI